MTKISNQYSLTNVLFADAVNGRVGIGTTTPSVALDVTGAGKFSTTVTAQTGFKLPANGNGTSPTLAYNNSLGFGVNGTGIFFGNLYNSDLSTAMQFRVTNAGGTDITAMTITQLGVVGIGITNPAVIGTNYGSLAIAGSAGAGIRLFSGSNTRAEIYADDGALSLQASGVPMIFYTSGEKMRITSGGNVGIGTTTPGSKLQIGTMASYTGGGYTFAMSNGSTDFLITVNGAQTGSSVTFYSSTDYYFNRSGPSSTGIINAFGFNNVSDYRLKYDLESFDGLSLISQIKTYKYKMEETHETQYGVLAHEIQEVLPHLVVGVKDGDRMQSVDYQKIVPMLIKSVQEQQLQINELKALLNAH